MRKYLTLLSLLLAPLFVVGASRNASAFTLYVWQNFPPCVLQDQNGVDLAMGCYVQMIWDADGDGIDDPMTYFGGVAPSWWIADGCPPVGGDEWVQVAGPVNVESEINVMVGYFYEESITPINPALEEGECLYTRFFTSGTPGYGDWYGDTGLWHIYLGDLVPSYSICWFDGPFKAHTQIVPEPSVLLLVGAWLLLVLIKLKF